MTLLHDALEAKYLVLSSVGPHAREDWRTIIERKIADIEKAEHSIWVVNSNAARPHVLRVFCTKHDARYVIFVSRRPDSKVNSGPSTADRAQFYSEDGNSWSRLQSNLSHVTGNINQGTTGFWLDALEEVQRSTLLDLGCFRKEGDGQILTRFWQYASAYPVKREDPARDGPYHVMAVGRLAAPFAVGLKM